jgi:hypothetical protein
MDGRDAALSSTSMAAVDGLVVSVALRPAGERRPDRPQRRENGGAG